METRWFRRIGPGIAALGAVAAIASTTSGAPPPAWRPPACQGPPALTRSSIGTWYRLDPTLVEGTYVGQRLTVGAADILPRQLDLAAESFATGPAAGAVLVGSDDGRRSRLSLIDVANGCAWPVATSTDVVRNAILATDGRSIVESRVDRRTRADLGIWRRPLDGSAALQVLAPIEPDDRFGRTWLTDLAWGDDGATLVVGSCGETACRYRSLQEPGAVLTVADPTLGSLVGLAGDRLVTREACRGLPCPIVSVDVRDGERASLADAAGDAVLARDPAGRSVVVYASDLDGSVLEGVAADGEGHIALAPPPPGFRLVAGPSSSGAAAEHAPDRVVLGPDGRLPLDGSRRALLRKVGDESVVALDEVLR